jgi:hypothetical protein
MTLVAYRCIAAECRYSAAPKMAGEKGLRITLKLGIARPD